MPSTDEESIPLDSSSSSSSSLGRAPTARPLCLVWPWQWPEEIYRRYRDHVMGKSARRATVQLQTMETSLRREWDAHSKKKRDLVDRARDAYLRRDAQQAVRYFSQVKDEERTMGDIARKQDLVARNLQRTKNIQGNAAFMADLEKLARITAPLNRMAMGGAMAREDDILRQFEDLESNSKETREIVSKISFVSEEDRMDVLLEDQHEAEARSESTVDSAMLDEMARLFGGSLGAGESLLSPPEASRGTARRSSAAAVPLNTQIRLPSYIADKRNGTPPPPPSSPPPLLVDPSSSPSSAFSLRSALREGY
jgi:hypothetical protein